MGFIMTRSLTAQLVKTDATLTLIVQPLNAMEFYAIGGVIMFV